MSQDIRDNRVSEFPGMPTQPTQPTQPISSKYHLTLSAKSRGGKVLRRVQALRDFGDVKAGDLGGWIEKESNLSHHGDCWVYDDAEVFGDAQIRDNAQIRRGAQVLGEAEVFDNAKVLGSAKIGGCCMIFGESVIGGEVEIGSHSRLDSAVTFFQNQVYYAEVLGEPLTIFATKEGRTSIFLGWSKYYVDLSRHTPKDTLIRMHQEIAKVQRQMPAF